MDALLSLVFSLFLLSAVWIWILWKCFVSYLFIWFFFSLCYGPADWFHPIASGHFAVFISVAGRWTKNPQQVRRGKRRYGHLSEDDSTTWCSCQAFLMVQGDGQRLYSHLSEDDSITWCSYQASMRVQGGQRHYGHLSEDDSVTWRSCQASMADGAGRAAPLRPSIGGWLTYRQPTDWYRRERRHRHLSEDKSLTWWSCLRCSHRAGQRSYWSASNRPIPETRNAECGMRNAECGISPNELGMEWNDQSERRRH